jgi:transposase
MIVERLLHPCSKLATTRDWHSTTLAEELGVSDASENDLYEAMDWLLERKLRIEKKLAERHLSNDGLVLYDVSSSYYEGRTGPLARFGPDRDGETGLPIIVYDVITDIAGRPIAVDVYPGNTNDKKTVVDQIVKLRQSFGLSRVVLVGDRGMLTQPQIDKIKEQDGWGWITALTSTAIRQLAESKALQLSLLDQKNLMEITSSDYPGERLITCYNPLLADERKRKRQELLEATEKGLRKIVQEVARRTKKPLQEAEMAMKAGKVLGHYKVSKHFVCTFGEGKFTWARQEESIQQEAQLDGIYVLRTSESQQRLSAEDTARSYKGLSQVERAFRCLKGIDLLVRPIHHRDEDRVRAHIFLCLLAYYVEWHLRPAWAPLLFEDQVYRKNESDVIRFFPQPHRNRRTKKNKHGKPQRDFPCLVSRRC